MLNEIRKIRNGLLGEAKKELVTLKDYVDKINDLQKQIARFEKSGDDCHLLQKELDRIHKEYRRKFPRKEKPHHGWS